ncbi:heterokaryon incompatibility protein-domain-containing protein [Ilyonectria destructans]|nr:heterokaryon incompatibility protein-domain-containing protein [Ilyonectria destructans]
MAEANTFLLCKHCTALTINDRILDHLSEDPPYTSEATSREQPELIINCNKTDTLPDLPKLAAAADAGCQFCAFLLVFVSNFHLQCFEYFDASGSFEEGDPESFQLSVTIDGIRYFRDHDPNVAGFASHSPQTGLVGLAADVHIYHEKSQEHVLSNTAWFPLRAKDASRHIQNPRIGTRPVSDQPLSEQNLALITGWISDCDSHAQCSLRASPRVPTRLIDIGDSEGHANLRLLNTADHENLRNEPPRYIALSYCWGTPTASQNHLKTTPITFEQFLNDIPYGDMPQTLRDAVEVARKLSVRYIWIDALCIIQDDADQADWKTESMKMKDVYGHAYLTIAPISSHSSFDGFLSPEKYIYMRVPIRSVKRPEMNDFCLIGRPIFEGNYWHGTLAADTEDSTWNRRGWTLQEEELSRRILYFGERTIHFVCDALSRSGDLDISSTGRTRWLPEPDDLSWCSLRIPGEEDPIPFNSTYERWYSICSNFSTRSLKNQQDTLPAISGLAEHYATSLKLASKEDTYLLGLWGRDILSGLCWASADSSDATLSQIPTPYCRPSWTWASHNGKVEWESHSPPTRFVQGKCRITPHVHNLEQNPFGMNEGCLLIDGHIKKIEGLLRTEDFGNPTSWSDSKYAAQVSGNIVAECRPDFEGLEHLPGGLNLSLLLLAESRQAGQEREAPWLIGLILNRMPAPREFEFIRVGVFRIQGESSLFNSTEAQLIVLA